MVMGWITKALHIHFFGLDQYSLFPRVRWPRLFYFYIFRKYFLQKYIFNITFYSFVPLPPGRGAAGGLPPSSGAAGTYM